MDTELMLDVGQANEFKLACRRAGFNNSDIKRLCEGDLLAQLLPVIRGHAEVTQVAHVIDLDADPLIPYDGWTVEEHKKGGQFTWNLEVVGLYLSPNQMGDKCIEGNKLRRELAKKSCFNANLMDYLLRHPHLIPEAWKVDENGNTRYIYFWDTIYRGGGFLFVRFLCFSGGHWGASCRYLGFGFRRSRPAAVRAS